MAKVATKSRKAEGAGQQSGLNRMPIPKTVPRRWQAMACCNKKGKFLANPQNQNPQKKNKPHIKKYALYITEGSI
ncbi:MAG: hypothetical protein R3Y45_02780 [Bacillota bacterium]